MPPTATPPNVPEWDKSSLTVEGECYSDEPPPAPLLPTFFIKNAGTGDMLFPSLWGIRPGTNGAATCADLVSTFVQTGTVKLAVGEVAMIVVDTAKLPTAPYTICVQQQQGHPGVGWAAATIPSTCRGTALDDEEEPEFWRLFMPAVRSR